VVEAAPNLGLTTAEVGGVIQGKQIDALPVNGRYWASMMALVPGAISSGTGTQDAIRFAGLSQEDNNFRFDGVDATGLNHQFVKEPARLQFPLESISEFKASAAVYSADVGGMAGGQVSMVSKGGGNSFHGSAYEYLRNSFFDAKALTRLPSRRSAEQFRRQRGRPGRSQQAVLLSELRVGPPGVLAAGKRVRAYRRLSRASRAEVAVAGHSDQCLSDGQYPNRRSQCAALDRQRAQSHQRRRRPVSH
jgi:hypothetical protein